MTVVARLCSSGGGAVVVGGGGGYSDSGGGVGTAPALQARRMEWQCCHEIHSSLPPLLSFPSLPSVSRTRSRPLSYHLQLSGYPPSFPCLPFSLALTVRSDGSLSTPQVSLSRLCACRCIPGGCILRGKSPRSDYHRQTRGSKRCRQNSYNINFIIKHERERERERKCVYVYMYYIHT